MTRDELAALDAKATKGEWLMRKIGHDHLQVHNALEHEVLSSPRAANALLAAALVNAWRTGQLVVAPSVEALKQAVWDGLRSYHRLEPCAVPKHRTDVEAIATAVLTSMGVKT